MQEHITEEPMTGEQLSSSGLMCFPSEWGAMQRRRGLYILCVNQATANPLSPVFERNAHTGITAVQSLFLALCL